MASMVFQVNTHRARSSCASGIAFLVILRTVFVESHFSHITVDLVISTTAATSPSKWHEARLGCNANFTGPVDSSTCFHNLYYLVRKQSLNLGQDVPLLKYFPESGSALLAPGASARTTQIVACKSPSPNHNRPSRASTTVRPRTCFSMEIPGRWAPKPPARAIGLDGSDLVAQGTNGTVNAMTPRHEVNKFCKSHS